MKSWFQVARSDVFVVSVNNEYTYDSLPRKDIKGPESTAWAYLRVWNCRTQTGWYCGIHRQHFGSDKVACEVWLKRDVLVTFFGDTVYFLDLASGELLHEITFETELYIQDISVDTSNRLLVCTAHSVHCFDDLDQEVWCAEDLGVDGTSICSISQDKVLVSTEDPGNIPSFVTLRLTDGVRCNN